MKYTGSTLKAIYAALFFSLFMMQSLKGQNGDAQLVKSDTTGADYSANCIIKNVDLSQVTEVIIISIINSKEKVIKRISILPVGTYFELGDESHRLIKDFFYTTVHIKKGEFNRAQFAYKLAYKDKTRSYPINNVW
jgi:hypothetical protein